MQSSLHPCLLALHWSWFLSLPRTPSSTRSCLHSWGNSSGNWEESTESGSTDIGLYLKFLRDFSDEMLHGLDDINPELVGNLTHILSSKADWLGQLTSKICPKSFSRLSSLQTLSRIEIANELKLLTR
jgi:hypothetical protein